MATKQKDWSLTKFEFNTSTVIQVWYKDQVAGSFTIPDEHKEEALAFWKERIGIDTRDRGSSRQADGSSDSDLSKDVGQDSDFYSGRN